MMRRISIVILCASSVVACSPSESTDSRDGGLADRPRLPPGSKWTVEPVDKMDVGEHLAMTMLPGGAAAVAYFPVKGRVDGTCDTGNTNPPDLIKWDLRYAQRTTSGWSVDTVAPVISSALPPGLDLAVDSTGRPHITTLIGGPFTSVPYYCSAHDLGLYVRDGAAWASQTVVSDSNEAYVSGAEGVASNAGIVVGHHPALDFDPQGQAWIAYQDVHFGGLQGDDFLRADLEAAWSQGGGAWNHIPVDTGRGAGVTNDLAFDAQGRPIIVTYNPAGDSSSTQGVWAARSADEGASWQVVRLLAGPTVGAPTLAVDPSSTKVHVAYYRPDRGQMALATLTDPAQFESLASGWTRQVVGDPRYDEGYDPSIGVASDGTVAAAYYRCTVATGTIGACEAQDDGLVVAFQDAGGWAVEEVEGGSKGECGRHPALQFGASKVLHVAYTCQHEDTGGLVTGVYFATREAL